MNTCQQCGAPLGSDSPEGLCPRCLVNAAMRTQSAAPQPASGEVRAAPSVVPDEAAPIREQLGPIQLIRRIGKGGMGEVWLARHSLLERNVAVKLLTRVALQENDPALATFIAGARVAAALEHPGLNKIYHADVENGLPYLVLELLDGPNLAEWVEASGPLDLPTGRAVLEAVAEAVAGLHQRDLVHRDLKPSNIVLTRDGRVVVTDFGLACVRPAAARGGESVAGTPAYMAPEMFAGAISSRTDVYALGMTAYHLLCGRPAFAGNIEAQHHHHCETALDPVPLSTANVPAEVIEVIERATRKDPLFRPKSAWQMLAALRVAFDTAGVKRATAEQLARTLKDRTRQSSGAARPQSRAPSSSSMIEAISEMAARKRETRPAAKPDTADPGAQSPPLSAARDAEAHTCATERAHSDRAIQAVRQRTARRRILGAGVVASLFATWFGGFCVHTMRQFDTPVERWIDTHIPHRFHLGRGNVDLPLGPLFEVAIIMSACLGAAILLYRFLRGARLPPAENRTACGWCEHELRGLSQPVCPECGHRIGDRGPDAEGRVPTGLTHGRRPRVAINIALWGSFSTFVAALILGWIWKHVVPRTATPVSLLFYLAGFFGCAVALFAFEVCAEQGLRISGRSWCRSCRGELKDLSEPVCPACHARI